MLVGLEERGWGARRGGAYLSLIRVAYMSNLSFLQSLGPFEKLNTVKFGAYSRRVGGIDFLDKPTYLILAAY